MSPDKKSRLIYRICAVFFWILLWELISFFISEKTVFASPHRVIQILFSNICTIDFWSTIWFSLTRIGLGFLLAFVLGLLFAVLSAFIRVIRYLLFPFMCLVKAVPVASFIILALLWIRSSYLSILISFLMVLPIIYTNVLNGIDGTDIKLLEMAKIFRVPFLRKLRYIYLPSIMPALVSACSVALGFCWKSGIAAEVIGLPNGSIGERLYEAKLYLMTGELFAWTAVIVIISLLFEKLVMFLIHIVARRLK